MKKHWKYFSYVIRHKWWVLVAGLATRAPLWRLLIHDWTKFLPCEWFPYVESFYGTKYSDDEIRRASSLGIHLPTKEERRYKFNYAWNHHQKANPHHWQYWILTNDSDDPKHIALQIPVHYMREMVADWMGAGRAITGTWECAAWYAKNKSKIILDPASRNFVEFLIEAHGSM